VFIAGRVRLGRSSPPKAYYVRKIVAAFDECIALAELVDSLSDPKTTTPLPVAQEDASVRSEMPSLVEDDSHGDDNRPRPIPEFPRTLFDPSVFAPRRDYTDAEYSAQWSLSLDLACSEAYPSPITIQPPHERSRRCGSPAQPLIAIAEDRGVNWWYVFRLVQLVWFFSMVLARLSVPSFPSLSPVIAAVQAESRFGAQLIQSSIDGINFAHHFDLLAGMHASHVVQASALQAVALSIPEVRTSLAHVAGLQTELHNELVVGDPSKAFRESAVVKVEPKLILSAYAHGVKALHLELSQGVIYVGSLGLKKAVHTLVPRRFQVDHPNNRLKHIGSFATDLGPLTFKGTMSLHVHVLNDLAAWVRTSDVPKAGLVADFLESLLLNEDVDNRSPRELCLESCPSQCVGEGSWCMPKCRKHCSALSAKRPPVSREEYEENQSENDRSGHRQISDDEYCDASKQRRRRLRQSHPDWYEHITC
jgi:hypothetical protein